jgi:hypothetical protein
LYPSRTVLLLLAVSLPTVYLIRKYSEEKEFLTNVFLIALLLRIGLGIVIHIFDLRVLFGPDARFYDLIGKRFMEMWLGLPVPNDSLTYRTLNPGSSGWGMQYIVASIYSIFGPSILVAQTFCGVIGALTAPMVYFCAERVFRNKRVSKTSALFIALFPAFVIWSSQLLKDGLIIFLLVFIMTMVLELQKRFSYLAVAGIVFALIGIFSLRFYIFYMVAISVVGSFVVGLNASIQSIVRNIIIIVVLGLALTYLGVIRTASLDFEKYGSLERIQISRLDLAASAESGFGSEMDVSTTEGALFALPIGLVYLMFAPFPWQVEKMQQALILPEILLWWALFPVMISGLWYTLNNRLRPAIPILLFSIMLTLSYSIFQGNLGMLYRQRTQIQVFLFIFIAVGLTLFQERREYKELLRQTRQRELRNRLRARQNTA